MLSWGKFIFLLVGAGFSLHATALRDEGPKFGPEFTFQKELHTQAAQLRDRMLAHLVEGQEPKEKFAVTKLGDVYSKFLSPYGWAFFVSTDPGVVEIQMDAMTAGDYERFSDDIQDAIFVSAYNEGLYPGLFLGGGHVNIDVNYFLQKPPLLLRNFIVDRLNHSELSLGIMNYDTMNALSFSMSPEVLQKIRQVVNNFDLGGLGQIFTPSEATIYLFLNALQRATTTNADLLRKQWGQGPGRGDKGWEISFSDSVGLPKASQRIELRAVRPQANFGVWLRQIRLMRDRLRFLELNFSKPIPFEPSFTLNPSVDLAPYLLSPPMEPQEALRRFYLFVTETGHDWQDHRDYLWPNWIYGFPELQGEPTELAKFESGRWFKEREAFYRTRSLNSCRRILAPGEL